MSDMLERAAKALWEVGCEDAPPWPPCDLDRDGMLGDARAALLAALDPEDERLVELHAMAGVNNAVRDAPEGSSLKGLLFSQRKAIAREVVRSIRSALAQGVPGISSAGDAEGNRQ